jgi:superfamily I DNA and RNA helicase
MVNDLVKRLRCDELWPLDWDDAIAWCRKAADRIQQLEARIKEVEAAHFVSCKDGVSNMEDIENQEKRIEKLEAALSDIIVLSDDYDKAVPIARKALEGKDD